MIDLQSPPEPEQTPSLQAEGFEPEVQDREDQAFSSASTDLPTEAPPEEESEEEELQLLG